MQQQQEDYFLIGEVANTVIEKNKVLDFFSLHSREMYCKNSSPNSIPYYIPTNNNRMIYCNNTNHT
jgi:hypothetical protein